jgi:hypothetical protein
MPEKVRVIVGQTSQSRHPMRQIRKPRRVEFRTLLTFAAGIRCLVVRRKASVPCMVMYDLRPS